MKSKLSALVIVILAVAWATVNVLKIPVLNLLALFLVFFLFMLQYKCSMKVKTLAIILYIGAGIITEPLGLIYLNLSAYKQGVSTIYQYYMGVMISEIIRFTLVIMFCNLKKQKRLRVSSFPVNIRGTLVAIPLLSTLISCCVGILTTKTESEANIILSMSIIMAITFVNFFILYMIERYNEFMQKKCETERYMDEMHYKEQYYQEVEESYEKIRKVKHDMKNRLTGFLSLVEDGETELLREQLKEMIGEVNNKDNIIFADNPIVNSVIRVKDQVAKQNNIRTEYAIKIPKKMQLDYGDVGVLYGNLLDNAIESCMKLEPQKRWIDVTNKFMDGQLLLKITNAKDPSIAFDGMTTKADSASHGRGIKSVQNVAEKYGGSIQADDQGNTFEVFAVLYGIVVLS